MPQQTRTARTYAIIGRMLLNMFYAIAEEYPKLALEDRFIFFGVAVRYAEGHPLTVSKLAGYTGLPRPWLSC